MVNFLYIYLMARLKFITYRTEKFGSVCPLLVDR